MKEPRSRRDLLASYFEEEANWQYMRANDDAEAIRNKITARKLHEIAAWVGNPASDRADVSAPRMIHGSDVWDEDGIEPAEEGSQMASSVNFFDPVWNPNDFLAAFVAVIVDASDVESAIQWHKAVEALTVLRRDAQRRAVRWIAEELVRFTGAEEIAQFTDVRGS